MAIAARKQHAKRRQDERRLQLKNGVFSATGCGDALICHKIVKNFTSRLIFSCASGRVLDGEILRTCKLKTLKSLANIGHGYAD